MTRIEAKNHLIAALREYDRAVQAMLDDPDPSNGETDTDLYIRVGTLYDAFVKASFNYRDTLFKDLLLHTIKTIKDPSQ